MKYLLLIYGDEQAWTEAERAECYVESTKLAHDLQSKGQFLATAPLQPVATATTVKVRERKAAGDRWPFRGGPRTTRRLLPGGCEESR